MGRRLTISKGGQISVPAAVRKRWQTRTVVAEDRGDHMVVRPAPDDPIRAARGVFADRVPELDTATVVREARDEDVAATGRKYENPEGD